VRILLTFLVCVLTLGCGDPKLYRVVGTVSWQGQAVADGNINFLPEDGSVHPVTAKITNGRYDAKVPPGKMKVEIWADKDLGYSAAMHQNVKTRLIPEQYNSLTRLSFDVQPKDDNMADFALPMK
jgi:hypothetical protein